MGTGNSGLCHVRQAINIFERAVSFNFLMLNKTFFFLLLILVSVNCFSNDWLVGGIYSVPHENNSYVVVKILKTDSIGVHLRLYSNVFSEMPEYINEAELKVLSFNNELNLPAGAEHVAISHGSFNNWGARFVQQSEVSEEELAAFQEWFDAKGGFF